MPAELQTEVEPEDPTDAVALADTAAPDRDARAADGGVTPDVVLPLPPDGGGADAKPDQEIDRAAEISQLSADIEKFQDGYDQVIGEWGMTLSGGQRQRVAIARAVIAHPAILILDAALSSIDSHTESEIRRRLQGFMEGRTSLVITHRLITAREADLIVLLETGRVEETGTHDELIAAGGAYARMWNAQQLEERIDRVP